MKFSILTITAFLFISIFAGGKLHAQQIPTGKCYDVLPDSAEGKLLRGIITVDDIIKDTSFSKWYEANGKYFKPKAEVVDVLKQKAGQYQLVLFVGTWCHDTQQLLPAYLKSFEAAGVPDSALTLIAADRQKTTIANLHKVFNVPNVPTIIVMKNGKEVGRVEEFGKTAIVDAELAEILKQL